jgi:galactokinase
MTDLKSLYEAHFGKAAALRVARGPGRVNLIGEHTDYNGGFVMPMALGMAVRLAFVPRPEPTVTLWSEQYGEEHSFPLDGGAAGEVPHWLQYPMRVAEVLREAGLGLRGLRGVVSGDVPVGSGLSSSAACEVASALALLAAAKPDLAAGSAPALARAHGLATERLAVLCQQAEHRVGVRCGIMDQFISLHGRAGHAVLLDCRDLSHEAVPLPTDRAKVVIIDSAVQRKLTAGAYNERRGQCEEAAARLRQFDPAIRDLRDVSPALFQAHERDLPEAVRRRARHVIGEIARTLESAEALKGGDLDRFGALMNASHDSLRDDYEVSGPELDLLVEIARGVPGVLGSRLTGAGFGGCTVTLARPEAVEPLRRAVEARYPRETGLKPRLWACEAADGAAIEA